VTSGTSGFAKLGSAVDTPNTEAFESNVSEVSPADAITREAQQEDVLAELVAERDRLAAGRAECEERVLRLRAEFDNFRRRAERDRGDYAQFAAMELIIQILPALDDFERALQVETADKEYARGVELIYQRLLDTLKRMGLEPIETAGRVFDPNLHQAVERVETSDAEDQAILGEYQKGYSFKGKLVRPAMVKVAVHS
jgi:molecular chaperone GrpE